MKSPKINKKTEYEGVLHVNDLILFAAHMPYVNLNLKYAGLIKRIDKLNIKIESVYESYNRNYLKKPPFDSADIFEHSFFIEEIIYWLRKTADEIISLLYICHYFDKHSTHPNKIKFEKIDDLLKQKNSELTVLLAEHLDGLVMLKNISNAYKHSFVNSDLNIVGAEEPIVPALSHLYNDSKNPINFYNVKLSKIIDDFDKFYNFTDNYFRMNYSSSAP